MGNAQVAEQENEGAYHEDSQSLQHFANLTGSVKGRVGKDPKSQFTCRGSYDLRINA